MMKKIILLFCFLFSAIHFSFGQAPLVKQWDARFGGTDDEWLNVIKQTRDGGYILGGYTYSGLGGDKTQANWDSTLLSPDFWIVKIDSVGNKQWDKDMGGTRSDELTSLQQTRDGGYILGGSSNSGIGGDKSQKIKGYNNNYWVVKTDSLGNKQWDADFGGNFNDILVSLEQTKDGGYILGGYSFSGIGYDKSQDNWDSTLATPDYWIIKIDSLGKKQWDKDFGGTNEDLLASLQQTQDGGYILGGYSNSGIGGNKSENLKGAHDYWIVKIDSLGYKQWDKDFGGNNYNGLTSLQQTSDKGFILGGRSDAEIGGDKTQNSKGSFDYWIVKIDSIGNKQWDKDFGGTDQEFGLGDIVQTFDGGYLMGWASYSQKGGDKTENNLGMSQSWILKTDSSGNKIWDKTIFTNSSVVGDEVGFVMQCKDGGIVVANFTLSDTGGYKTQLSRGGTDYWLVKFRDTTTCVLAKGGAITSSRDSICNRSGATSSLKLTGYSGSLQWQSSVNGVNFSDIPGASSAIYTTPRNLAQTTFYRSMAINNCGADSSNVVIVHVIPSPSVNFNYTINGKQIIFQPDSVSANVISYHWDFGDNQISNDTNPVHTFDTSKTYYVCVTVYNGSNCSFTRCQYVSILSTGVESVSANPSIQLYPNPANNTLNLSVAGLQGNYRLKIYNVLGQPVGGIHESPLNGNETIPIDLSSFAPGTYELILMSDKEYYGKRFVHLK